MSVTVPLELSSTHQKVDYAVVRMQETFGLDKEYSGGGGAAVVVENCSLESKGIEDVHVHWADQGVDIEVDYNTLQDTRTDCVE